jgi:hypothetical protein
MMAIMKAGHEKIEASHREGPTIIIAFGDRSLEAESEPERQEVLT